MFFLSLALLGQSATLQTEPFAAITRAHRQYRDRPGPPLPGAAVFNYYLMVATVRDPQPASPRRNR